MIYNFISMNDPSKEDIAVLQTKYVVNTYVYFWIYNV